MPPSPMAVQDPLERRTQMSDPTPLTPPAAAATQTLVLTPPAAPAPVVATQAPSIAPLDSAALPGLDAKAAAFVDSILALDAKSPEFSAKANDVRSMGDEDVREAAETSNRLLQTPVKSLSRTGDGSKVASTLIELRRTVEDLDPKEATGVKKL